MGEKSYLKDQVRLVSLTSYDFFTPQELAAYLEIVECKKQLNDLEETRENEEKRNQIILEKKARSETLDKLIAEHSGVPRTVRLDAIVKGSRDGPMPPGVTWKNMKFSKKIAEFSSELTRAMGLKDKDDTLDLIVVNWKSLDILKQLVEDGFSLPVLNPDGTVTKKKYRFFTSSAGQLRRDKILCVSEEMWEKVRVRIECGLTEEEINRRGGCNQNKLMAYRALVTSATDPWEDFDIDRCIVIPEFEGEVTGRMMYIKPDYTFEDAVKTVTIDHTDGAGMMLPSVYQGNFIARGPWIKGLLSTFDYLKFCRNHDVPPVIRDVWGMEHDLIAEDIQIIFTESQFKMHKYYDSWQDYKDKFKSCGARFGRMNYEEEDIGLSVLNYQMLQTLEDVSDEEITQLTRKSHDRILNITQNEGTMLKTLGADVNSDIPYKVALAVYPEFLWEAYTRNQLKDIRKRILLDSRSGKIRITNKRLFAIPDWYAACERWFLHEEHPKGLLKADEIACGEFIDYSKADVLRSPHLYMEHHVAKITRDPQIYQWFTTRGCYTSCHSLISRVLQFDVDGETIAPRRGDASLNSELRGKSDCGH